MAAKRQPDGALVYRGVRIEIDPTVRPDRPGRYVVNGRPFAQLSHAKAHIDSECQDETSRNR